MIFFFQEILVFPIHWKQISSSNLRVASQGPDSTHCLDHHVHLLALHQPHRGRGHGHHPPPPQVLRQALWRQDDCQ